jgi:hypothetical protein
MAHYNLPVEYYLEMTMRYTTSSLTGNAGCCVNLGGSAMLPGSGYTAWIEPDNLELIPGSSPQIFGDGGTEYYPNAGCWGAGTCGGVPYVLPFNGPSGTGSADFTQYLKLGVLFTSDGTSMYKCYYLNDVLFQHCAGKALLSPPLLNNHHYVFTFNIGSAPGGALYTTADIYVQSIKVWVCPGSYGTTQGCVGTIVNH